MSRGYTRALASTAPVAPAAAFPQGERATGFDWAAIVSRNLRKISCVRFSMLAPGRDGELLSLPGEGGAVDTDKTDVLYEISVHCCSGFYNGEQDDKNAVY